MTEGERIKLDYYALGKMDNIVYKNRVNLHNNKCIADTSGDLMKRNALSLNSSNLSQLRNGYRNLHTLNEVNKEQNNYLNPVGAFNNKEKYNIHPSCVNKETFNLERKRLFAKDREWTDMGHVIGEKVTPKEYIQKKNQLDLPVLKEQIVQNNLNENSLYFDKNNNQMIRYPKGFWNRNVEYFHLK